LVFPNRHWILWWNLGYGSKWADTIPAYAWFIETDCWGVDQGVHKSTMLDPTDWASWCSDNTLDLYLGGVRFESCSWMILAILTGFSWFYSGL
jgi:hypothetical protein